MTIDYARTWFYRLVRVSYDGTTVDYRSVAAIDRAIAAQDREIAAAEGRRLIRQVRVIPSKRLYP